MVDFQNNYFKIVTSPGAIVDNASYTTNEIDTVVNGVKYDYLTVLVTIGATDITMAALKLQQSDTSGSGFADVTGAVGGTDFSLPTDTDDDKMVAIHVDLKGKKRYFDLVATAGNGSTGTYLVAHAFLSRGKQDPITATAKNLLAEVII